MLDKGAVIQLEYGVEGFATPKHLVKEDGSQAQLNEKLQFKVIEFNKESKRIILSPAVSTKMHSALKLKKPKKQLTAPRKVRKKKKLR